MVCELSSIDLMIIRKWVEFLKIKLLYSSKGITNHGYSTGSYSSFIHKIMLHKILCCFYVCSTAIFYTKIQGDPILGFFMYLLFLGIAQTNAMKLDNALFQKGKLCFGKILWCDVLFLASYRRAFTETGSLTFRILCKCKN